MGAALCCAALRQRQPCDQDVTLARPEPGWARCGPWTDYDGGTHRDDPLLSMDIHMSCRNLHVAGVKIEIALDSFDRSAPAGPSPVAGRRYAEQSAALFSSAVVRQAAPRAAGGAVDARRLDAWSSMDDVRYPPRREVALHDSSPTPVTGPPHHPANVQGVSDARRDFTDGDGEGRSADVIPTGVDRTETKPRVTSAATDVSSTLCAVDGRSSCASRVIDVVDGCQTHTTDHPGPDEDTPSAGDFDPVPSVADACRVISEIFMEHMQSVTSLESAKDVDVAHRVVDDSDVTSLAVGYGNDHVTDARESDQSHSEADSGHVAASISENHVTAAAGCTTSYDVTNDQLILSISNTDIRQTNV